MIGVLLVLLAAQDVRVPEFTRWEFARERVGHRLVAEVTLANVLDDALTDVRVTAVYYDQDKELRRSKTHVIPRVLSGASSSFTLEAEQVPNFTRYEVYVEYKGQTRLYLGTDPRRPPTAKKAEPARLQLLAPKDSPPASFPGDVGVALTVRNFGESEAQEPTAVLVFLDGGGAVVQKARVRLDAGIPPASDATYLLTVPRVGAYASMQASTAWLAAEGPPMTEPAADAREVVVRQNRLVRLSDGSARVSGIARNGLAKAVDKVTVAYRLGKLQASVLLPGALKPGAERAFEHYVPDCPPFDAGGYNLTYEDAAEAVSEAPPAALPSVRRVDLRKIEISGAKLPDAPARPQEEGGAAKAPPRVELRGLMMVEGRSFRQGDSTKYTGDTYLLRLHFTDDKGARAQPTPTLNFVIYNGQTPFKKVQRIVNRETWKVDASKINQLNVADNTMALDKKTGELWVAFLRTDGPGFDPRADLSLTIRDAGTWTWKGLGGDNKFEAPARSPDPPAKK
jgi:hypothetical protein